MRVGYRTGDMWAPKLSGTEALRLETDHFVDCIENDKVPETDGRLGLRVVELIEAAVELDARPRRDRVHPEQEERSVIPFVDLKAQYQSIKTEVNAAIQGVLESCQFTLGSEVAKFEEEFASYCGAKLGIGVNIGHERAPPRAARGRHRPRRRGDHGSVHVRRHGVRDPLRGRDAGLRRHRPRDLHMDPAALEAAITPRTQRDPAGPPVRPDGGHGADPGDRAQARAARDRGRRAGARRRVPGQRAGSLGDMACFSFYPGKNLGAYGEGGMVVDRQSRLRAEDPHAARLGRGEDVPPRAQGLQLPARGHPGRGAAREAAPSREVDRGAPRGRGALRQAARGQRRRDADRPAPQPPRLPRLRDPHPEAAGVAGGAAGARDRRRASTTRSRCTCCRRSRTWATSAATSRTRSAPPHEVLSLPMFAELTPAQSETVANAVRELAAAG